jgi:hypothetical protein
MAGRAKENLPGGSLKYLFVYLKIRIFKCSYRIYIYMCVTSSCTESWDVDLPLAVASGTYIAISQW